MLTEKDATEKTLEAYNDVFADIVNVLLFDGQQVVNENDLVDAQPFSQYKIDGKIHEQERDVAKYWMNGTIRICLYGFENQTEIDRLMPLRIISYDGAAYRSQMSNQGAEQKFYPVITLVLYFGEKRWKKRNLSECLEIPEILMNYISDYMINVFEIAWLSPEQVKMFKSDFKIVADYFVQKRVNKNYTPSKDTICHVDEILKVMKVLTGDRQYEVMQQKYHGLGNNRTEGATMDDFLTRWHNDGFNAGYEQGISCGITQGIAQGISRGMKQGIAQGIKQTAKKMLRAKIMTNEQVSELTGLSVEEIKEIAADNV